MIEERIVERTNRGRGVLDVRGRDNLGRRSVEGIGHNRLGGGSRRVGWRVSIRIEQGLDLRNVLCDEFYMISLLSKGSY